MNYTIINIINGECNCNQWTKEPIQFIYQFILIIVLAEQIKKQTVLSNPKGIVIKT